MKRTVNNGLQSVGGEQANTASDVVQLITSYLTKIINTEVKKGKDLCLLRNWPNAMVF